MSKPKVVAMTTDGNIDRRVLDQGRSLAQAGWDVKVVAMFSEETTDEQDYPDLNIIRFRSEGKMNINEPALWERLVELLKELPCWPWYDMWTYSSSLVVELLKHPADVYIAHDLPMLPFGTIASLVHQSYLVYDSHEIYSEQATISISRHRRLERIEEFFIAFADHVITVNRSISEIMAQKLQISPPQVIWNSPSLDKNLLPLPKGNLFHQRLDLAPQTKIALYQGNIVMKIRNLENLVDAMAYDVPDDLVLILMGHDYSNATEELAEIAEKKGTYRKKVFILPPVSQRELLKYTCSADVGIIPYAAYDKNCLYCAPNKLFEFLVAGLPILSNDMVELNEYVAGHLAGLNLPLYTPTQIASALRIFFSNDVDGMRKAVQERSSDYLWSVQGSKFVAALNNLITPSRRPSIELQYLKLVELNLRRGNAAKAHFILNKIESLKPQMPEHSGSTGIHVKMQTLDRR